MASLRTISSRIGRRTGGWGILHAVHAALVMREQDFWPAYDYMWDTVPEWKWDPQTRQFVGAGPELPAKTLTAVTATVALRTSVSGSFRASGSTAASR